MNTTNRFKNDHHLSMDEPWIASAVEQLQKPLAPSISAQLRAARYSALEQPARKPFFQRYYLWGIPTLASVFAIMLSLNLWDNPREGAQPMQTADSVLLEDLPIMKASDDWELYKNIEFLNWMEQDDNGLSKG